MSRKEIIEKQAIISKVPLHAQIRPDNVDRRPDLVPFITKVISTHRKLYRGKKRIMAVISCLGITKTVHLDVPRDYAI